MLKYIIIVVGADEMEESLMRLVFPDQLPHTTTSPVALESFRRQWIGNEQQPIPIDKQSSNILRDIFTLYKKGLNVRFIPDVAFKGEDGTDASGPTREYFHLCMSTVLSGDGSIRLFEGEKDHRMPIHCTESLDSQLFYYLGLMISHSFLHDGYPLVGISKAAVAYLITGSVDEALPHLTPNDILCLETREIIEEVSHASFKIKLFQN